MSDLPLFQSIKLPSPPSNEFDLSFSNHLTTDFGRITPILVKESLPGDEIKELGSELFIRSLPLVTPVMGRIKAYIHAFFVPNRIMWSNWERFISGWDGITIADQTDPVAPYAAIGGYNSDSYTCSQSSLGDYLGIPVGTWSGGKALAFRVNAYERIYDEWYRDQNLESSTYSALSDGLNYYNSYGTVKYRAYKKDYFTSALPWPQRGSQMTFPLGVSAPVKADSNISSAIKLNSNNPALNDASLPDGVSGLSLYKVSSHSYTFGAYDDSDPNYTLYGTSSSFLNSSNGRVSNLYADLAAANVLTVNEFRRTMALQRWLETNARGGSRYNETLYAHFGVKIPDYRINRSQYLGGSSVQFNVSVVPQQSETTDSGTPQGTLVGNATAYGYCAILDEPFKPLEHGVLMMLLTIMPDALYYQGLDRHLSKFDKFDYAWPEFAHLGEQEVRLGELMYSASSEDNDVFGYQSRFAEDKFSNNELHGNLVDNSFRSWTLARALDSNVTLSNTFIKVAPSDLSFIFADTSTDYDHFIVESYNHYKVNRALPIFGTPE